MVINSFLLQKKKLESHSSTPSHDANTLPQGNIPRYMTPLPYKPISKKERHFARNHSIFLVRNLDKIRDMKQRGDREEEQIKDDTVKGTTFLKRGRLKLPIA